jgi:hypothetical protein
MPAGGLPLAVTVPQLNALQTQNLALLFFARFALLCGLCVSLVFLLSFDVADLRQMHQEPVQGCAVNQPHTRSFSSGR